MFVHVYIFWRRISLPSSAENSRLFAPVFTSNLLKDVLGHSLEEVASITGASEAAAKSALQRGRARLREIAMEPADISLPILSDAMRARLIKYVEGFKTGDFDAAYFVAIDFDGDRVVSVHDFLYARYAMDGIDLFLLYPELQSL